MVAIWELWRYLDDFITFFLDEITQILSIIGFIYKYKTATFCGLLRLSLISMNLIDKSKMETFDSQTINSLVINLFTTYNYLYIFTNWVSRYQVHYLPYLSVT